MINKAFKILLVLLLILGSIAPSLSVFANEEDQEETSTEDKAETEGEESEEGVSGNNSDSKAEENKEVGMPADDAKKLADELLKTLIDFGITGKEITVQFAEGDAKEENSELFNKVILVQLQLYELLYAQAIEAQLEAPVLETTMGETDQLDSLSRYLLAFNATNEFLKEQKKTLEGIEDADETLVEAIDMAIIDTELWQGASISPDSPLSTEEIRKHVQDNLNRHTAQAISLYFKYLNDGEDSEDIDALKDADTEESTRNLLSLVRQWEDLPHIKDAPDSIKLLDINNVNQDWLEALQDIIDDMESDTEGATDKDAATADNNTSAELATSALGRMGSSLFTVRRSAGADNDPDKPVTGTLGWVIFEELRDEEDLKYDPGPAAKDDFLAMFASTAVYTPFVSHVGDKDYLEAYKALFNETAEPLKDDNELVRFKNNSLGPLDVFNSMQNLRKPLYYFNDLKALGPNTVYGHSTEEARGVATLLTVNDLIKAIKQKNDLAAITLNGVMSKDGDSFSFYNYSLNQDGQVETSAPSNGAEAVETEESENGIGAPIVNKVHASQTVNGGETNTRVIFEMSFNDENPGVALMTGLLMHNIYNDTILQSRFKERANEAVYVDAVGNIVLNDGLVVLPAAANPTYWAMPTHSDDEGSDTALTWKYNPFTVAFMDTYPAIYQGGKAATSVNQKKDKDKYVLSGVGDTGVGVTPLKKSYKFALNFSTSAQLHFDFKMDGTSELISDKIVKLDSVGVDGDDEYVSETFVPLESKPYQFKSITTPEGESIFPYISTKVADPTGQLAPNVDKDTYRPAILIAKNMYAYIIGEVEEGKGSTTAADGKSGGGKNKSSLREGFLFNNVTMPVLTGLANPTEFDKANAKSDLLVAGGDTNIIVKWILNFSRWLSDLTAETKNILSIASADDSSVLKLLYGVFVNYGFYIAFIVLMVLIVVFLREVDFMGAAIRSGLIVGLLALSLFVIPAAIPSLMGISTNFILEDTGLKTLMTKLEMNEDVNQSANAGDSGVSVKLYNLSPKQAKELNEQYGYDDGNYLTNRFPLNDNLGLYVSGTELRLDLYSFWRFDPLIIATEDNVTNPNTEVAGRPQVYHSDHSKSDFVVENDSFKEDMNNNNDVIDYYMPFNLLENGFMKTINTYLQYYDPPQSVVKYPDGLAKSSYVVNTYMKSLAFLAAEPEVAELIASSPEEGYAHKGISQAEVALVNQKFYPYGDIMNLQDWVDSEIEDLPSTYANSIWTNNMYKSGYYDGEAGKQKRVELANRVNRKAYDIIMEMNDTKGLVSDETLIKLVALYATFEFNKEISYAYKNVYPRTIAYNEISASDIVSATVIGQSSQFLFYDTDPIANVYGSEGIVGVIAADILLIALLCFSILMSLILPAVLFISMGVAIYLVFTQRSLMPALILMFKVTVIAILLNLAIILTIKFYHWFANIYVFTAIILVIVFAGAFLGFKWLVRKVRNRDWVRKQVGYSNAPNLQGTLQETGGTFGGYGADEVWSSRRGRGRASRYEE